MTSNNLEAIELLKTCVERLQDQGFSSHGNTVSELNKAIDLLQADEVELPAKAHKYKVKVKELRQAYEEAK